jgi:glutamate synthase (NADPH/NADH) small chain
MKKDNKNKIKKSIFSPFKALKFLAEKPVTIQTPFEHHEVPENYRGFHVNDLDKCLGCGSCARICDNAAIRMVKMPGIEPEEGRSDMRPVIDYGRCCWCALCVDICPSASLSMTKEYTHVSEDLNTFLIYPNKRGMHGTEEEIGYRMDDKAVNFLVPERIEMKHISPEERSDSFIEMVLGYSKEEAQKEAERCLGCGLCTENCPAHMHIPEYIAAIWRDDTDESLRQIYKTNPLPAVCGRICTHRCEDACALTVRGEAVAIRWLKRFTADSVKDFKKALEQNPKPESGKKVAVIGAGPAGISAAYFLRLMGHAVTVFEQFPAAGGAVRFGPPAYRLPFDAVDRDANYVESLGAEFRFNTTIGKDITFEELQKQYDAIFMGIGYTESRSTRIPNSDKCLPALRFLRETKMMGDDQSQNQMGKEVIVIGGGNVAMDVAREAVRVQNIKFPNEKTIVKVFCLEDAEHMPADPDEIREGTEEGIQFNPAWGPQEVVLDEKGNIKGLRIKKVLSIFDSEGKFNPQYDESSERVEPADMIFPIVSSLKFIFRRYILYITLKIELPMLKINVNAIILITFLLKPFIWFMYLFILSSIPYRHSFFP